MFIDIHVKDSITNWRDENTSLGKQERERKAIATTIHQVFKPSCQACIPFPALVQNISDGNLSKDVHVGHLGPFFRNNLPSSRNIPVEKKSLQKSSLAPTKSSSASKRKNHQRKIPTNGPFPLTIELASPSQLITRRQPSGQSPTQVPPNFKRKINTSPGFCRTPPAAHA